MMVAQPGMVYQDPNMMGMMQPGGMVQPGMVYQDPAMMQVQ